MTAPTPIRGTEVVAVITGLVVQYNMAGDWVEVAYGPPDGTEWAWVPTDTITPR